ELVEKHDGLLVERRADDLAPNAFAQSELADWYVHHVRNLELRNELFQTRAIHPRLQLVDVRQQVQAVGRRKVVPELRALAKDRRYAERELLAFLPRHQFQNPRVARCRIKDAREHLDRRRLARAIGSDERQRLARLDT